jgi:hypothetical protein
MQQAGSEDFEAVSDSHLVITCQAFNTEVQTLLKGRGMALALTDDGPDIDSQPSRLFVLRQEYQTSVQPPVMSTQAAIEAMAQSLQQLHWDAPNHPTLPADLNANPSGPLPPGMRTGSLKEEKNHKTQTAQQRLDVVKSKIHQLASRLALLQFAELPLGTLQEIEKELAVVQGAFDAVMWQVESVTHRKKELKEVLDGVQQLYAEVHGKVKAGSDESLPADFNSG